MDQKPIPIDQEMAINANGFLHFCKEEGFQMIMFCRNPRTGFQKSIVYASPKEILSLFSEYLLLPEGQSFATAMTEYMKELSDESIVADFQQAIDETMEKFKAKANNKHDEFIPDEFKDYKNAKFDPPNFKDFDHGAY